MSIVFRDLFISVRYSLPFPAFCLILPARKGVIVQMSCSAQLSPAEEKLWFASDYMEGAHPAILDRLLATNLEKTPGYGADPYSASAREKIRAACSAPEAEVFFLAGGTQANAVVISSLLRSWQGVVAAETGHICAHEAGAIEHGGHKVLTLPQREGKISAGSLRTLLRTYREDENRDHLVAPGMVYLSQPTEYGTLYSLQELEEIRSACLEENLLLYVDGARLAYALASSENSVSLPDLARLCDAFYIGGTKCGALFGEAVVFPRPGTAPHFFTQIKQSGALLAKGRIAGLQFDTLFTDGLYLRLGQGAVREADRIRAALRKKGIPQACTAPTNQVFVTLDTQQLRRLSEKVEMSFWEKPDPDHTVMRIATSWATSPRDVDRLISLF